MSGDLFALDANEAEVALNVHDRGLKGEEEKGDMSLTRTAVEQAGAEEEVIEDIINEIPRTKIIAKLKTKYPGFSFSPDDLKKFVHRNKQISQLMIQSDQELAERHVQANFIFKDKLLDMQSICEQAMHEAADEREYGAIANLSNAILKNIQLFARLSGHLDGPSAEVNVNVGHDVVKLVSDKMASKRDEFLSQVNIIDVDIDEEVVK